MLVTTEDMDSPIIGYNVIEELIVNNHSTKQCALSKAIPCSRINELVSFVKEKANKDDFLEIVKVHKKKSICIPQNSTLNYQFHCKGRYSNQPIFFEPDVNPSLKENLIIGETIVKLGNNKKNLFHC